jgi:hypothetical protein
MDIKILIQDIFAQHGVTESGISELPAIIAELVELVEGVAEATADGMADNLAFTKAGRQTLEDSL